MSQYDGQLNGTELGVYIGTTLIAFSTNATLNINHSTRSTSSKDSGGWADNMEGMRDWDVSVDALYAWTTPIGSGVSPGAAAATGAIGNETLTELFASYIQTRTIFSLKFGNTSATGTAGYSIFTGDAWITSASLTAPMEDTSTFTVSFQGTGQLLQTVTT